MLKDHAGCLALHGLFEPRQTPHMGIPLASAFPPKPRLVRAHERRGRGSVLTICLARVWREHIKGATARAWLDDAHSYISHPSRLRCLLMIASTATSSRLTPIPHTQSHMLTSTCPRRRSACLSQDQINNRSTMIVQKYPLQRRACKAGDEVWHD